MVGEASRSWGTLLMDCLQTFANIPARGNEFDLERPQHVYLLGIGRDLYQLALMDLFGLMDVKRPSQPVQPWRPAGVAHLPFGNAVFTLLAEHFYNPGALLSLDEDESQPADFGAWQPIFQPYFPEWRENLRVASPEPRAGVFLFRVALGKARRLIAMPADATLDDLVSWVLSSVEFSSDHLYEFIYRDQRGRQVRVHHPYTGEAPSTDQVHVGELPLKPGQSMTLVYDFGDNWQFNVTLERIEPPGKKMKAPRIVESHGAAPNSTRPGRNDSLLERAGSRPGDQGQSAPQQPEEFADLFLDFRVEAHLVAHLGPQQDAEPPFGRLITECSTSSNCPVSTVSAYRKMAASTIQPMGNRPNAAPSAAAARIVPAQAAVPAPAVASCGVKPKTATNTAATSPARAATWAGTRPVASRPSSSTIGRAASSIERSGEPKGS